MSDSTSSSEPEVVSLLAAVEVLLRHRYLVLRTTL